MTAGLFYDAVPRIHKDDHQLGIGSAGNHIAGILNMSGCISNNEFSFRCGEVFISYINCDALLSFRTKTVGKQCQINASFLFILALFLESFELITQYVFTVKK